MPAPDETVEDRLTRLEELVERLTIAARKHPLGRQILIMLGLS